MALPHQSPGTVITAADHWNPIVDAINSGSDSLDETNQRLSATNTDVSTLKNTVNAAGSTAAGNAALSSRLGTGVTASNTATSQLNALTSRATALESTTGASGSGNAALASRVGTLETRTTDASTGNSALGTRVTALESGSSGGGGGGITASGFMELADNARGFTPTTTGAYQVVSTGKGTYIQFPNPGKAVTVYGSVAGHVFAGAATRGGFKIEINLNDGNGWQTPAYSPLAGIPGTPATYGQTTYMASQYAVSGTPGGVVQIRATAMLEVIPSGTGFFRTTLYANMLGGNAFTTG